MARRLGRPPSNDAGNDDWVVGDGERASTVTVLFW